MRAVRPSPSLLILPAAAGVYVAAYLVVTTVRNSPHVAPNYVFAAIVTWIFTLLSRTWFLRKSLAWTPLRARQTTLAALLTGGVAAVSALYGVGASTDLGLLLGGIGPPLLWVLATAWIWRETDAESFRQSLAAGAYTVSCPGCGYNLRGLRGTTRCPECGTEYTLDELVTCQFRRGAHSPATTVATSPAAPASPLSPPPAGHDASGT